jgi:hypothetical protein
MEYMHKEILMKYLVSYVMEDMWIPPLNMQRSYYRTTQGKLTETKSS